MGGRCCGCVKTGSLPVMLLALCQNYHDTKSEDELMRLYHN